MIFQVNTDKKTIKIMGSYKFEDLDEVNKKILSQYEDYTIVNDQPDLSETVQGGYFDDSL